MANIELFENPSFGSVRVVMHENDPWFVAKDVCECLALDVTSGARGLDEDEKGLHIMQTPGGNQELSIISESGLYSLVLRSRKPEAKAFKRWVTHEVLPSIRKTGMYAMPKDLPSALRAYADAIEREKAERAEKEKAQAALQAEQSAHLDTQYDLLVAQHNLTELNNKYSVATEMGSVDDMRSAYDMQVALIKYFDTGKCLGTKGFWWYMSGFMHTYCHGGIRYNKYFGGVEYALPGELIGHVYHIVKRGNTTVFPKRAWADVIAYFEHHQDSLKDLPRIGYAAR